MEIIVTVGRSSHPDFELFASTTIRGRQLAMRGDRAEVNAWYDRIATAARDHGHTVTLVNEQ